MLIPNATLAAYQHAVKTLDSFGTPEYPNGIMPNDSEERRMQEPLDHKEVILGNVGDDKAYPTAKKINALVCKMNYARLHLKSLSNQPYRAEMVTNLVVFRNYIMSRPGGGPHAGKGEVRADGNVLADYEFRYDS